MREWPPDRTLDGTVALVTGASSGIGEATAKRLAAEGAAVAVGARRLDRLEKLVAEIADAGGTAVAIEADVTDRAQAEDLVERTVKTLGRLDTVVNNAGVMLLGPALDAPIEEWEQMVDLNVKGLLYVAKAALPHLLEGRRGGAADGHRPGQHLLRRRPPRALRQRRLQRDQVRRRRLLRGGSARRSPSATCASRWSSRAPSTTELSSHNRPEVLEEIKGRFGALERLEATDIADAIAFIVTRPRHVAINEILVRPTEQRD